MCSSDLNAAKTTIQEARTRTRIITFWHANFLILSGNQLYKRAIEIWYVSLSLNACSQKTGVMQKKPQERSKATKNRHTSLLVKLSTHFGMEIHNSRDLQEQRS